MSFLFLRANVPRHPGSRLGATEQRRRCRDSIAGQGPTWSSLLVRPCWAGWPVSAPPHPPPRPAAPLAAPGLSTLPTTGNYSGRLPGKSGRWLPMLCAASCWSPSPAMSVYPQRRLGQGGAGDSGGGSASRRCRAPGPQRPLAAPEEQTAAHTQAWEWCPRRKGQLQACAPHQGQNAVPRHPGLSARRTRCRVLTLFQLLAWLI